MAEQNRFGVQETATPMSTRQINLKRRIATLSRALNMSRRGPRILLYHSVAGGPMSTSLNEFKTQIGWLARNCSIIDLELLLEKQLTKPAYPVAITFDDGYVSVYTEAKKILDNYNAPATVYLNTGWIDHDIPMRSDRGLGHYPNEYFLLWGQVNSLRTAGWTIGSHGVNHFDLTRLCGAQLHKELARSRQTIEAELREPCRHFAYTWGRYNRRVKSAVMTAGYCFAASCHHGVVGNTADPFAFPRINVDPGWTLDDLRAVIQGDWDYLNWIQRGRLAVSNFVANK